MSTEADERLRGMIVRGIVLAVDDTGDSQVITVQTHDGVIRDRVEVMQFHGFASRAAVGAQTVLFAVEGDQGHYMALPPLHPGFRFGGLQDGQAVLYDDAGNRLLFGADGTITLGAAGLLRLVAQSASLEFAGGSTIHGPVTFTDDVTFQGNVTFQKDVNVGGALHVGGPVTGASFNGRP